MKEKNISILKISVAAVLSFVLCYSQVLYSFDKIVADKLYQVPSTTDTRIKIIAIDERTLQEYGNVSEWSREIPAQLVEMLNEDKENAPAVIGFDIMYVSDGDEAGDARFAQACEQAGNVITAVNVVTKDKLTLQKDGSLALDTLHIEMIEYPYDELKEVTEYAFANTTPFADIAVFL